MTDRPFMLLNRLVINGHGRAVYDQTFHAGVNIIRGENSSGKSTISDMIFYVLGGENVEWTDEAASCDLVQAEFNVSGLTLSLRREITSPPPSIAVCEGSLTETMKSLTGWSYYGRQRSDSKESFSQFMF
ncbi:MAG: AAA family ATPase, partial [Proteobacteria bacterium]|nr:AAA family ATPase [Pseudomonadota bacterium]